MKEAREGSLEAVLPELLFEVLREDSFMKTGATKNGRNSTCAGGDDLTAWHLEETSSVLLEHRGHKVRLEHRQGPVRSTALRD